MTDIDAHGARSPEDRRRRQQIISDFSDVIDVISRSLVQEVARNLADHDLTVLQYHALRAVATFGPEMDMSSIGTVTGLPASTLTSVFDRLDRLNLVTRRHDERDRRRVVASLSPDGAALMQRLREDDLDRLEWLLAGSDTDDLATTLAVFRGLRDRQAEREHP